MAYVKCSDCGKIYDTSLETCPQCGCPTEQQQLPPTFNGDDNTPVDITRLFHIEEDKFEETKDIWITTMENFLSSSIDDVCQSIEARSPKVQLAYHVEKGVGQLQVCYNEYDFLEKIESLHDKDLADKYGWACRRMIINIDDKENIRLDLENNESIWNADFPISQELFLKCCNAKKLEFKITKENGESIIVNGYNGFDPDSGAEIDKYGIVMPENALILNFQALYNYVIDPNMFKDAPLRAQMLNEWVIKQLKSLLHKKEQEVKGVGAREENKEIEPSKPGSGYLISGFVLLFLGIILFAVIDSNDALFFFLPPSVIVVGIILLIYGFMMRQGYSSDEVTSKLEPFFKNLKT